MPAVDDHPMRLRRLRAQMTQVELAALAGVRRAVIAQIEEGRVRRPNAGVVTVLAERGRVDPEVIEEEVRAWQERPTSQVLSPRAQNTLLLPPHMVAQYRDFVQWRRDIAPNPTAFASLMKLPRLTVVKFERGEVPMPKPLFAALASQLGLSAEYIEELRKLDVRS